MSIYKYQPKPEFEERMKKLIVDTEDYQEFEKIIHTSPLNFIRCNTLKISPEKLKTRLEEKGWKIKQEYKDYPEIMLITSNLMPGELGKSTEHILGYYYVQELSSMMPALALNPKENEFVLDLCASPGSKTTQISAMMQNRGTILANDKDIGRTSILSANLERCGCSNVLVTRHDAVILCDKLKKLNFKFDKILLDLPCSGEGNFRSNPKTFVMWNKKMILKLSRLQRKIASSAVDLLKDNSILVYSTCTHAPEENEAVVSYLVNNFNLELEEIKLPIKTRHGISSWEGENFVKNINKACRIYPQDNNTEGFFLARLRKNP